MTVLDILMLLLGASVSLHTATAAGLLSFHSNHSLAHAAFASGGTAACTLTLWLTMLGLYQ